jgi:hypothetical protein
MGYDCLKGTFCDGVADVGEGRRRSVRVEGLERRHVNSKLEAYVFNDFGGPFMDGPPNFEIL